MPRMFSIVRNRFYLFIILILLGGIWIYFRQIRLIRDPQLEKLINYAATGKSMGCKIRKLDPWNESVMKFYKKQYPLKCKPLQPNLISIKNSTLFWNSDVIQEHGITVMSLKCQLRCVRKTRDDIEASFDKFTDAPNGTALVCDVIHVKCSQGLLGMTIYDKYLSSVIPDAQKIKQAPRGKPNIIFLITDGQSRSNFIRQLPETYKYLMDELGAIEFPGMNKAGLNSYPNCMALFANQKVDPFTVAERRGPFDDKPLIFFNFSRMGYVTQLTYDWPKFDVFNYDWKANGFLKEKPFDHYQRPMWLGLWSSLLHLRSTHLCYDNTPKHKLQLDYVNSLFDVYPMDVPKFSIAWINEVGHEYLNDVGKMDLDLLISIKQMRKHLDNSYLFVMGDHGHRIGPIRETLEGRYEDRLPFFSVTLPKWFSDKYPDRKRTFEHNAKEHRLVTFYDVFAMMAEILHETIGSEKPHTVEKGISLFRSIPANRSCSDIHIDSNDCSCSGSIDISIDHKYVQTAADTILDYVNNLIFANHVSSEHNANCIKYKHTEVKLAQAQLPQSEQVGHSLEYVDITINVYLNPGNVLIESSTSVAKYSKWAKVHSINRINRYGNQSHCTDLRSIQSFCFCDDML